MLIPTNVHNNFNLVEYYKSITIVWNGFTNKVIRESLLEQKKNSSYIFCYYCFFPKKDKGEKNTKH